MTFEVIQGAKLPIKAWVNGVPIEDEAKKQLINTASLPFIFKHVAVMPDVHWGMGATIGSVIATKGAIIPAAVGVDIGCGMLAVKTSLNASDLPDDLKPLRHQIEQDVPHGDMDSGHGGWLDVPPNVVAIWTGDIENGYHLIKSKHPKIETRKNPVYQFGSLGGGNHFIEICLDENQAVWIMLHSGSRGIGNKIGHYFIELARKDMEKHFINLPDRDLAYLIEGTEYFNDYFEAVSWAQEYAHSNRRLMLIYVIKAMRKVIQRPFDTQDAVINCHHNYVEREHHYGNNVLITRKGAVRARENDIGIIPGSMGAKSFIVRGKGNPESFQSCSHGAGRAMSRNKAKSKYTVEDHIKATEGVECRKDTGVLDEIPHAYKDIDAVMAAQSDLVDIVHTLKQVLCVKG